MSILPLSAHVSGKGRNDAYLEPKRFRRKFFRVLIHFAVLSACRSRIARQEATNRSEHFEVVSPFRALRHEGSQLLIEFAEFRLEEITTIDEIVGMFPAFI